MLVNEKVFDNNFFGKNRKKKKNHNCDNIRFVTKLTKHKYGQNYNAKIVLKIKTLIVTTKKLKF